MMEASKLETELIEAQEPSSKRLMIVLHGLGDSMDGYRWLPEELNLPTMNYLLVNAPDEYYGGYSWYDFAANPAPGVRRSYGLIKDLLLDYSKRGFPSEQTFLFGFSQGCLMTIETGMRFPSPLAGLIGISGYIHEPEQLLSEASPVARQQRILMTHGTLDTLIPIAPVRLQVDLLKRAGMQVQWHEFPKAHTIAGQPELDVIRSFVEQQTSP